MEKLTTSYLINGPNNVFRLSNGTKIIYIFGDYHNSLANQTECELNDNYESIDFDKLLYKFMKQEKDIEYDFFFEQYAYNNKTVISTYRDIYIKQINKFINSKIKIINNKIITIKYYSNFRFHYFDIRYSIYLFNKIFNYINDQYNIPYKIPVLNIYKHNTTMIIKELYLLNNYILHNNTNKFINKLKNKYTNKQNYIIINDLIKILIIYNINNVIKKSKNIIKLINKLISYLNNSKYTYKQIINLQTNIYFKIKENMLIISRIFVCITDLYCIRRILDKNYINRIIIYTGSEHANNILFILLKYFNFKLTHYYYINKLFDINEITNLQINNFNYLDVLKKNCDCFDEYYKPTQCINLFNFPVNFS